MLQVTKFATPTRPRPGVFEAKATISCHHTSLPKTPISGVVSNNSQCQITRIRAAIARALSRKVSYAGAYSFLGSGLWLGLGLIIPTSRADLVLRVIRQCDMFGTMPAVLAGATTAL